MPEHLSESDKNRCQLHGDHSRRLSEIDSKLTSISSCQTSIKLDLKTALDRTEESHRRIDETNVAHYALVERVGKMNERFDDRDRDQDKRINKLSVQIAGLVALVQTLMFAVEHLFAK